MNCTDPKDAPLFPNIGEVIGREIYDKLLGDYVDMSLNCKAMKKNYEDACDLATEYRENMKAGRTQLVFDIMYPGEDTEHEMVGEVAGKFDATLLEQFRMMLRVGAEKQGLKIPFPGGRNEDA